MPNDKQSTFFHINDWKEFNNKLINTFGNIKVFWCKAHKQFNQVDQPLQTLREMVDLLLLAVNTLKSHIKCVAYFQDDHNILNSITLNLCPPGFPQDTCQAPASKPSEQDASYHLLFHRGIPQ